VTFHARACSQKPQLAFGSVLSIMDDCAVIFDMDGVLWYGGPHSPIEGASEALKSLVNEKVGVNSIHLCLLILIANRSRFISSRTAAVSLKRISPKHWRNALVLKLCLNKLCVLIRL
jgi:ribonucleotide monophosphatase NagD (HAD superfamily)